MNIHEYQAKELFASYGIPVPRGTVARTPDEAVVAAQGMGGDMWVVKAQVHAGGRGKAGGVKLVRTQDEVRAEAERMLNMKIKTYQTGGFSLPVDSVLIAEATAAMAFGASAEDIGAVCHAHPTLSEVVKEAAMAVDKRAIHS